MIPSARQLVAGRFSAMMRHHIHLQVERVRIASWDIGDEQLPYALR